MRKRILLTILTAGLCSCAAPVPAPTETRTAPPEEITPETWLDLWLDPFVNDGYALPDHDQNGNPVTWHVADGDAEIRDGSLYKTEGADEYEPVSLSARLADGSTVQYDRILLLDPYVAYIISYFSENGDEKETMKLAYTYNGSYWYKFNNDHTVLKAETGTGRLRDPAILRNKDGTFTVLATQGYDTDSIYVFDSPDLLSFANERLLKVNTMGSGQAWAPEGFYDRTLDQYVIYWSSVKDKGMFRNLTADFRSVDAPVSLLDCGFPVIDGTIVKQGAECLIVLKDERQPMEQYSRLFIGRSEYGWQDFTEFGSPLSGHQSEGPMVMKDLYVSGYYLVYDDYTRFQFKSLYTQDLWNGPYEETKTADTMIPLEDPAHCSAVPVTWKELERLIEAYE